MVKTGKFLENAIDLMNLLKNENMYFSDDGDCYTSCIFWNTYNGCTLFRKNEPASKYNVIRHPDCIRIFGE